MNGVMINYWAVLVSAIASMIIGSIWYGPLFGKLYMQVMGMDQMSAEKKAEMKKGMAKMYIGQFIASLLTFFVLAWIIGKLDQFTISGGLMVGFWIWLGFILPIKFGEALWGGKWKLFWLGTGSQLITLLVAGGIIGCWK